MVIVDTSVIIDYLDGRVNRYTAWLERQIDLQRIGITSLIQVEVLQGFRTEEAFLAAMEVISAFEIFETGSSTLAIASARNYRTLRGRGITIRSTIDCLIATFCIQNGYELLHNDRDFHAFEAHLDLPVLHP